MSKELIWIGIGTAAFGCFVLFEFQKCHCLRQKKKMVNPWFLLGLLLLAAVFLLAGLDTPVSEGIFRWLGLLLLTLGLLFYAKVLGIAAETNYIHAGDQRPVSRSGLYGRMRHPGVWSSLLCAVGYVLIYPPLWRMTFWLVFLNLIYIWLQDRFFFPVYLEGYEAYRKEVPYLLPFGKKK